MALDAQLQQLVETPTERPEVELKGWLNLTDNAHRAVLAKGIIALADHGGGFIIIGFESDGSASPARPANLNGHTQDIVNDAIERYSDPAFHCNVHVVRRIVDGLDYPVIVVPGGHKFPIRSKRNGPNNEIAQDRYYVRRPGPASEPPQGAHEWTELLERCMSNRRDEIAEVVRSVLEGRAPKPEAPPEPQAPLQQWIDDSVARRQEAVLDDSPPNSPSRMPFGHYTVAARIDGVRTDLAGLQAAMQTADEVRLTGWPPWWMPTREGIRPYPVDNTIECNMGGVDTDAAHADFWRVSTDGELYIVRGYIEDTTRAAQGDPIEPGRAFDLVLPIWRIGECLLYVERLARALGAAESTVTVRCLWTGLAGRELVALSGNRILHEDRRSRADRYESSATIPAASITATLPDLVRDLTQGLYTLFDFFAPPAAMFSQELGRMQRREF